jgi:hypothetical protein
MAIQINPVDFRGFSLGSTGVPQLPQVGALGLQAVQSIMSQQDNAANRDAQERMNLARIRSSDEAMLRQNIIERNKLLQQDNQFQQNLRLDKNKLKMLEQQSLAEQAYKNRTSDQQFGLDVRKQDFQEKAAEKQTALEQMKYGIEQLAKKKKEDLNNIGSFAAQAQLMLAKEKDPTKKNLLRNELTDQALALGIISKDQVGQFKQMPLSQFDQATGLLAFQSDKAKELQDMMKAGGDNKSNISLTVGPNGELNYNSTATTANVTASQEKYLESKSGLEQLNPYLNPPDNFFGLEAGKHTGTYLRELGKSIGIGSDQKDVDEMALYNKFNANSKLQIMQTAKSLAGARFSDADLKMIEQIMPQVGTTETKADYMAKADLVKKFLERSMKAREEILSTGKYKIGTPEYDKAFSAKLPSMMQEIQQKDYSKMTTEELLAEKQRLMGAK